MAGERDSGSRGTEQGARSANREKAPRSGGDDARAEPSSDKGPKQELAEQRTDWAQERTLLAKQRTFAAWLRTGLAAAGGGFAAAEFLGELEPQWIVVTASTLLVVAGAVIFVIGFVSYRDTFRKLRREGVAGIPSWVIGGVTFAMLLGTLLLRYSVLASR